MRIVCSAAWKPNVSGISTDLVLYSEHGAQLVHHYRVYCDCISHGSLSGTFMAKLTDFTNRACAETRSLAKCGRDSSTEPGSLLSRTAPSPLGPTHHTPDDDPSAGKLLGLWPLRRRLRCPSGSLSSGQPRRMSCQSRPNPGFPLLSTVLRRHLLWARFHQTGGDRPCRCVATRVSPHRISLWNRITHICTRSRPSYAHHCRSPSRRPLAMTWQNLTRRILVLLCLIPQCPTLCQWCL